MMKQTSRRVFNSLARWHIAVVMSLMATSPAYAYFEPVTVSAILQMLIAALASGFFAFKLFFRRVRDYFLPPKNDQDIQKSADEKAANSD